MVILKSVRRLGKRSLDLCAYQSSILQRGTSVQKQCCLDLHHSSLKRERQGVDVRAVGLFGACFDGGQPHKGVGEAPKRLREAGLVAQLEKLGCNLTDHGDLNGERGGPNEVFQFNQKVAQMVAKLRGTGQIVITLGGDHSVGIGTLAGHLQHDPQAVVIWVDAHADINTQATSPSGNLHGMPVSFNIPSLNCGVPSWLVPRLDPSRLAYIGLRDVDGGEKETMKKLGIASYYIQDIDNLGLATTVREALGRVDPEGNRKIHCSFDIDSLSPSEAPATGTPVRAGLTLREGIQIGDLLHSTGRLAGLDLVEVNPLLGSEEGVDRTLEAATKVVMAALGYSRYAVTHSQI